MAPTRHSYYFTWPYITIQFLLFTIVFKRKCRSQVLDTVCMFLVLVWVGAKARFNTRKSTVHSFLVFGIRELESNGSSLLALVQTPVQVLTPFKWEHRVTLSVPVWSCWTSGDASYLTSARSFAWINPLFFSCSIMRHVTPNWYPRSDRNL